MMTLLRSVLLILKWTFISLILWIPSCATWEQQLEDHMSMSIDEMKSKIEVKYYPDYDNTAVISTYPVWQVRGGLLNIRQSDYFVRGFINMKTGLTSYQVYNWIWYRTTDSWRFYNSASVVYKGKILDKNLDRIHTNVDCTRSLDSECTHYEIVTFMLTEKEYKVIIAAAQQNLDKALRYKLRSEAGVDHHAAISSKELIAFDQKLHEFRQQHLILDPKLATK